MSLFDQPEAHARVDDPETSHAAAATVNVTAGQAKVLQLLQRLAHDRAVYAVTHEQLVHYAVAYDVELSPSGVRTRCTELARAGLVVDRGETRTKSGRRATLWGLARHDHPLSIDCTDRCPEFRGHT